MAFTRGEAQPFPFSLVKKTSGDAFIDSDGTPSVYITIDGGTQQAAGGTPVYQGNGQWLITFTGDEIQGSIIGIMITHADAIPEHTSVEVKDVQDSFQVQAVVTVSSSGTTISDTFEYYGTLAAAEHYFDYRLDSDYWDDATIKDREKALIGATRLIDKLNYENEKYDDDQNLQFPRGDDTSIPVEIEYATYEIAVKLLEGIDSEIEAQALGVLTETYTGVRTTYQAGFVNEHLRSGIPSIEAWEYLKPFLRDGKRIALARVN
jgi:hypothetical protein